MSDQGTEYAAFIAVELGRENDIQASINSRAASALTGSTGLVTLVLAAFAVFIHKDFTLDGAAKGFLAAALISLLAAAVCALMALQPGEFLYTLGSVMERFLGPMWGEDEVDARNRTAYCNLTVLESLRVVSQRKVRFLRAAGIVQITAVAFLALCTLAVLKVWPFDGSLAQPAGEWRYNLWWEIVERR